VSARLLRLPSGRPRHRGRRSRRRFGTRRRRVLPRRVRRLRRDWRERPRPSLSARLVRTTPTVRLASPEPATAPITSAHPSGISGRPRARTSVIGTSKRPRPADPAWPFDPCEASRSDRCGAESGGRGGAPIRRASLRMYLAAGPVLFLRGAPVPVPIGSPRASRLRHRTTVTTVAGARMTRENISTMVTSCVPSR